MELPQVKRLLKQVDVDPFGFMDFGQLYFFEEDNVEKKLEFDEFMGMIMDLRESNQATVKSLIDMWMKVKLKLSANTTQIDELRRLSDETGMEFENKFVHIQNQVHDVLLALQKVKK